MDRRAPANETRRCHITCRSGMVGMSAMPQPHPRSRAHPRGSGNTVWRHTRRPYVTASRSTHRSASKPWPLASAREATRIVCVHPTTALPAGALGTDPSSHGHRRQPYPPSSRKRGSRDRWPAAISSETYDARQDQPRVRAKAAPLRAATHAVAARDASLVDAWAPASRPWTLAYVFGPGCLASA